MNLKYFKYEVQSVPVTGPVVAQKLGRGIVLLFHDRDTRRGEWSAARLGLIYPRERHGSHCIGGWVGTRAGLDGRKNWPSAIRSPDCPVRSPPPYRLSYPAHIFQIYRLEIKEEHFRLCAL